MMSKPQKKIILLWGLPGSGKTTYAKDQTGEDKGYYGYGRSPDSVRIDVDKYSVGTRYKKALSGKPLLEKLAEQTEQYIRRSQTVYLDGLLTTNSAARSILSHFKNEFESSYDIKFGITWWNPDREACLWNDRGRRTQDSKITIENLPFEEPSKELLKEFGIEGKLLERKKVQRKPNSEVWIYENDISQDKGYLVSSRWTLGGTAGSCWSDEKHSVSGENPPSSFNDFDELIERICPEINFLKYKRIYAECVTTDTESEGDYYGGSVSYAYFKCDLKKLYDMLLEYGLIKEPNVET